MDTPDRPSPESDLPRRDDAHARLLAALRALDADADRTDAVAPDPSRVAGHLAGVGDEGLLCAAAAHPSVRRLLSDVVSVAEAAEVDARSREHAPALSPCVLERALAAFDAATSAVSSADASRAAPAPSGVHEGGGHAPRVVRGARGIERRGAGRPRWRTAAAVLALLVPVGVVSFLTGRAEAGPAVALEGLDHVGADGSVATEGPRRLGVGATVSGRPGERLGLRLPGGGRVVLPGEDVLRVACDGAGCGRALFALDRGDVVLAVLGEDRAQRPVGLRLPAGGRFDLLHGAARLSREEGDRVVLVMRDDAVALWTPSEGAIQDLRGAGNVVLERGRVRSGEEGSPSSEGPAAVGAPVDPSARAAFLDLEFFGGARRDPAPERRIGARRWRVADEAAVAQATPGAPVPSMRAGVRRSDGSGVPSVRMDLPVGGRVRLAWEPDEGALLSRQVVVYVRHAPAASAPAAPSSPGRVRVELEGVTGAFAETELASDPGPRPVELGLTLPAGWADARPAGSELVLAVTGMGTASTVWFECAGFRASIPQTRFPTRSDVPREGASDPRGE